LSAAALALMGIIDQPGLKGLIRDKPVMLCCHPHGIWSLALLSNFVFTGGTRLVNGAVHVLTLDAQFHVPFWRDFCLAMGMASVSRRSIKNLLDRRKDVAIVLGGARESLDAQPGIMELSVRNRRGFFRIALQEGAAILPVLSFGELDLFRQIRHPLLRRIQERLMKIFSFALPLYWGRMGILPDPVQLTSVVGPPLLIEQAHAHPSREEIARLQEQYIERIVDLHMRYSHLSRQGWATIVIK